VTKREEFEKWTLLGQEIKDIRKAILNLMIWEELKSLWTARLIDALLKSVHYIDIFRSRAEDRIFQRLPYLENHEGFNVFYAAARRKDRYAK